VSDTVRAPTHCCHVARARVEHELAAECIRQRVPQSGASCRQCVWPVEAPLRDSPRPPRPPALCLPAAARVQCTLVRYISGSS
jgi:hypothetical protein